MKKNLGMMKRTLALILALVMTLSCAPVQAFATETVPPTEAVETVPAETTVPETQAPAETVPATEESTPETIEETEPTVSETEGETISETTAETVHELAITQEETASVFFSAEADSLDDIAWEDMTYRDIFIDSNIVYVDGFNGKSFSPFVQSAGTNTITTEAVFSQPYSLKAFGNGSQQVASAKTLGTEGDFFLASKVYCTRHEAGTLGVCLGFNSVGAQGVTDGFVTAAGIVTASASNKAFLGSFHTANLDGYVDDPVAISLEIFETAPSLEQLTTLYDTYVSLEKAREREEVLYSDEEMLAAFVQYMNQKAEALKMTNSLFRDPIGIDNISTANDLLRLMVYADRFDTLTNIWGESSHTVSVGGDNARKQKVTSTIRDFLLLDGVYRIQGGKTGTLSAYDARNLAAIVGNSGMSDRFAVVTLYAEGQDGEENDRFAALEDTFAIALAAKDGSMLQMSPHCQSAAACLIPYEGADLNNLKMLYTEDADTQRVPASITKVLTAVCALEIVEALEDTFAVNQFDTQIGGFYVNDFRPGDVLSYRDALYAMMLPSSNVIARSIARNLGKVILEQGLYGGELIEDKPVTESNPYQDKVISILSASTSTFAGYIPVADGFNLAHRARYPQDNLLTDVNETWWMQVINELDAKLGVNESWAGSQVLNTQDSNSGDLGPDAAMASLTRIQNLGSNGTPDLILFFGGGNDMGRGVTLGSFDPATAPTEVDLMTTKWDSFTDAYVAAILRLKHFYPNSKIVTMTSYPMPSYVTAAKLDKYGPVIKAICDHYGVPYLDMRSCGVTFDMLPDKIHPNAEGMDYITEAVLEFLSESVDMEAGEHVVYSVSHKVSGAKASLGHYKGVSAGTEFTETLEGENLVVTVTMGGKDITSSAYSDGKVTIPKVTGDLVITAKGIFNADGHLQQLPENICSGVNLWKALEPEKIYYTATGWGNTATNNSWSITFPVKPGDRIWATSLGAYPDNGSTANGVRVTWFDENGVLASLDRNTVYDEFAKNGYITAPEGAAALNLPMTYNQEHYAAYLLSAEHSYGGGKCTGCGKTFAGKTISILGDSISTYTGVSNDVSVNATLKGGAVYYSAGTLGVHREDTWWQQTIDALDMELLVNNSWSGSCILHTRSGTVGAYVSRSEQLHNSTTGEEPDVIAVFLGTNDFSYYQSALGTADIDYDALIKDNGDGTYTYGSPKTSCEAYAIMLHKMTQRYPDAEIYCMTLLPRRNPVYSGSDVGQPTAFNGELAKIIQRYNATQVDLEDCGITSTPANFDLYLGDKRVHPNAEGMDRMTEALIGAMLGEETHLYDVSCALNNVTADCSATSVLSGGNLTVKLKAADGFEKMTVTVMMGGVDVTDSTYSGGVVSIDTVTGDVVISASASIDKDPENYLWEFNGTDLVSTGENQNDLTKLGGSTSGGVLKKTYYQMAEAVLLRHDRPWEVQWRVKGSWSGMFLAAQRGSATNGNTYIFKTTQSNGFIGFGTCIGGMYHNYGIALHEKGVDTTALHTYRLVNHLNDDGTNMVYLYVDGEAMGAMNNYYIGGNSNQNKIVDWVNGKDFVFSYIGADNHSLNNCAMEYLQVWENGAPESTKLAGKTLSILGASISTFEGTSNGGAADTTNSTIRKNVKYYPNTTIPEVTLNDTWWMQVCEDLGLRLLVNNAWSGSAILLERSGTKGAYVDRCVQLHDDTGDNAGEEPDIICIQMGFNDFSYGKATLGTADIDYASLITSNGYGTPVTTMEATAIMLDKITKRYPNAEIYMFNHFKRINQSAADTALMEALNVDIETVCSRFGVKVVDLYSNLTDPAHIGDGKLHPNRLGMDVITEAVKTAILGEHPKETAYTVTLKLEDVTADYGTDKQVLEGDTYTVTLTSADELNVTVTMGGKDITAAAYAEGVVTIAAVTGDVIITAKAAHTPRDYRWEFDGTDLACTEGSNALTKTAGTTTDGVFDKTRYTLEKAVVLSHDQPWEVIWESEGTWKNTSGSGGRLFTTTPVNAHYNARYIFKSSVNGLIAMGEKTTTGSHNYGIALSDHGIDANAPHTYRLENRLNADGSNMIYLHVDGQEIGPMTGYYIGTNPQNTTSDWLSGKDFTFGYMGTDTHGFTNCEVEYIQVWEDGAPETLTLRYDDHYPITGKTVEILDPGKPTSYQVGYGVADGTLDSAVVTIEGDALVATGIGTARVRIDGQIYEVFVTAAPISLLLLIGQSNMEGMVGNANQSIACENGQVYSTYAKANGLTGDAGLTVDNAGNYVPSALAGMYSAVNVNGTDTKLSEYPVKSLTEAGNGKYGADSGIAYEWTKQTGEKVWVVNAAHGASSITSWQKGASNYEEAVALFSDCQTVLKKEIAAGHYTFSHMGYYWCQGCADETQTAEWYVGQYLGMHENLKADLAFDADFDASTTDRTLEFGNIILVMAGHETAVGYRKGTHMDSSDAFFATFKELEMRGPRVAQIWMANNPELADINMVCTLAQEWVAMPDGTDGVSEYFRSHYENGTVDYPTQTAQSDVWRMPTTPASVKNSIHYYQIGYNEVGREAARNTLYILDLLEKPEVEPEVVFYDWTGYQEPDSIKSTAVGSSATLVVPMVYPCYKSKDITYFLSGGLKWDYYDLLATGVDGGTLTASIGTQTVTVTGRQYCSYRFELVDGKMISISNDTFHENLLTATNSNTYTLEDTILLKHDKEWVVEFDSVADARFMALASSKSATDGMFYFFKSKSGSGVLSLGEYKDGLYQNYGLKQTEVNIDWTQPHVYQFRNKVNEDGSNTIHIYVDAEWMGMATNLIINDVLQSTDNMYLSGKDFAFTSIGCGGFALGDDQMTYLEVWETACTHTYKSILTAPTCTEQGYTTHTCTVCGDSYVDSYVAAKGHTEVIDKAIAATCTTAGKTEGKHCSVCNTVIVAQKEVPAKGHTEVTDKAVSATCTTAGKTEGKHCSTCGTVLVAQKEIPAQGHSYGAWTVTTAPTCTEKGTESRDCNNCDNSETRDIAAKGHTEVTDKAISATCTTAGKTEGKHCSVCNTVLVKQNEIPAKGHTWDAGKVTKEPTEQTEGVKTYTCTACGETKTQSIPVLSHTHKYTSKVTAPTCTAQGYTTYTCSCGDSYVDNYVKATGHSYGAWTVTTKPTCTEKGQERRDCSNCDAYETRDVAAKGHTEIIDKAVAATCITAGLTEGKHCSTCNTVLVAQKEVPAKGHSWDNGKVTKEPTEKVEGVRTYTCTACGETKTETIPTLDHTHKYTSKVTAPTCTAQGYTTYTCICGDSYVDNYVKATGHSYDAWTVTTKPTCTEKGAERRDCTNCDHYETRDVVANGHTEVIDKAVDATCTETGLTEGKHCSVCNIVLVAQKEIPAKGHSWDNGKVTKEPTEKVEGIRTFACTVCGETKTETIPTLDHTHKYTSKVTAPTCTAQGYTTYTCTCGDSYVDNYVQPNGHSYGAWAVTTKPTCTEMGTERRDCNNCDHYETREVTANGHTEVIDKAVAATCTAAGLTEGKHCSVCNVVLITQKEVPAKGHSWDNGKVTKEPTEKVEGIKTYTCTSCGETKTENIPTLDHTHKYTSKVTDPTCTGQGYTTYTCSCGDSYVDNYVKANGHSYGTWTVTTKPSCTEIGTERRDCNNCDHYETQDVAAKGHTEVIDKAVATTCTSDGLTEGKHCSVCNTVLVAQTKIVALGHSWDVGVVTKEPTETEEGESLFTCQVCGEEKIQKLPTLSHIHKYTAVVTEPTCTEQGYTTYTCSCGDSYVDDYVETAGHEAGQWQSDEKGHWRVCAVCSEILDMGVHDGANCTICGHEPPEQGHGYELGDVNHDGKINAKDATLILQKSVGVLKETAKFCEDCAEVSGDGKLNAKDSTLILQFSVGLRDSFPAQK